MKKFQLVLLVMIFCVAGAFCSDKSLYTDFGIQDSLSWIKFADTTSMLNSSGLDAKVGAYITEDIAVYGRANVMLLQNIKNYQHFSAIPMSMSYSIDGGAAYILGKFTFGADAGLKILSFGFNKKPNSYMMIDFSAFAKYTLIEKKKVSFGVSVPLNYSFSRNGYVLSAGVLANVSLEVGGNK